MTPVPYDGKLTAGGAAFHFGGVRFGVFDEATALETKQRFHELADGTGFSGRIEKTVPFGCEYAIVRTYDRFPGVLRVAVDVRALHGGAVAECALYAGIVGNLVDRVFRGHVVDFLDFHWGDAWHFPCFNVADVCITVAAGLLLAASFAEPSAKRSDG